MKTLKKKLWRRGLACIAAALALPAGCENTQGEVEDAAVIQEEASLMAREAVAGATLNEALDALFSGILTDMTDYRIDAATFAAAATIPIPKRALEIPASAWNAPEAEKPTGTPTGTPADTPTGTLAGTPAGTPADTGAADKTQARVRQIGVTIWNSGGRVITITLAKAGDTYTDAEKGSLFTVGEGVIFTLDGVTLDGLTETADGTDNNAALVTVKEGGVLRMAGQARITGNTNKQTQERVNAQGGGVQLNGGSLVMGDDAKIDRNTASAHGQGAESLGGGIHGTGGSAELKGNALVIGNAASSGGTLRAAGGGIYMTTSGMLILRENAKVYGNFAGIDGTYTHGQADGGGISAVSGVSVLLEGDAKVENNHALAATSADGGGIYIYNNASLRLRGNAQVSGNIARGGNGTAGGGANDFYARGGGIFIRIGLFEMDGGRVYGNTAQGGNHTDIYSDTAGIYGYGGGVYLMQASNMYMSGGEITGNRAVSGTITAEASGGLRTATRISASAGGGIYLESPLYMTGGLISENIAGSPNSTGYGYGSALLCCGVSPVGRLHISGTARIPARADTTDDKEDSRNAVAAMISPATANNTANHQSAAILIAGEQAVTEEIIVNIVLSPQTSPTTGGIDDLVTTGGRPLFWLASAPVYPPLPGRFKLERFFGWNTAPASADYYQFKSTDVSSTHEIGADGRVKVK